MLKKIKKYLEENSLQYRTLIVREDQTVRVAMCIPEKVTFKKYSSEVQGHKVCIAIFKATNKEMERIYSRFKKLDVELLVRTDNGDIWK